MFVHEEIIRSVSGLDKTETELAKAFIKGAVYCWLKNRPDEPFAVRDLFGGVNTNWTGTPLERIWSKEKEEGKSDDDAHDQAAKDVGWLLKTVLHEDKLRTFDVSKSGLSNAYVWVRIVQE